MDALDRNVEKRKRRRRTVRTVVAPAVSERGLLDPKVS
jgi:hypothetical protein